MAPLNTRQVCASKKPLCRGSSSFANDSSKIIYRLSRQVWTLGPPCWGGGGYTVRVGYTFLETSILLVSGTGVKNKFLRTKMSQFLRWTKVVLFCDFQCYTIWVTKLHWYLWRSHFTLSEPILTYSTTLERGRLHFVYEKIKFQK